MKKLSEIPINTVKQIHSFGHQIIARKLITMGVIPGKNIEIVRKTFLGNTLYVRVDDSHFAIRKNEAEKIYLQD